MIDKIIENLLLERNAEKIVYPTEESIQEHKEQCDFLIKLLEKEKTNGWQLCSLEMPKAEVEVLIMTENGTVTTAMYEDGTISEDDSWWWWDGIEFDYDEETDTNFIPEGWWEYKHFNGDAVYNNAIDTKVVFWQPLPTLPEEYKKEGGSSE